MKWKCNLQIQCACCLSPIQKHYTLLVIIVYALSYFINFQDCHHELPCQLTIPSISSKPTRCLCMYISVCLCMYLFIHTCIYRHIHIVRYTQIQVHTEQIHTHIHTHAYLHKSVFKISRSANSFSINIVNIIQSYTFTYIFVCCVHVCRYLCLWMCVCIMISTINRFQYIVIISYRISRTQ